MKWNIKFQIDCGKKTCASKPGKFCQFLRTSMNGKDTCYLFGRVFDKDGWLQRHPECLKRARLDVTEIGHRIKK